MKILSFAIGGVPRYGVLSGERVVGLPQAFSDRYRTVREVIAAGALAQAAEAAARGGPEFGLEEIAFLPPVVDPGKILCVGVNFANRSEEYKDRPGLPTYPSLFMRTRESVVGHGQAIVRPPESRQLDYEGEIAIVIGRTCRRVPEGEAQACIAGLTCMNEGAIRDWMRHGKFNVTQGKNFDRSGSIGPWLASADEFETFDDLWITTRVNGEPRQHDTTANFLFPFRRIVSYISTFTTLWPGDVIATGTPTGVGARYDPPRWLVPGDRVEVEVSGVGTLVNTVMEEE